MWPSLLPLLLCACGTGHAPPSTPPNWLLLAPDSLRADRVGPDVRALTPVLSALADTGVTFTHAFAQSGWTSPSLASLLTGHYPTILGAPAAAASPGSVAWLPQARTLPQILGYYGYHTAAFYGNSIPARIPAFGQGFEQVSTAVMDQPAQGPDVLEWLAGPPREPFFALVHEIDFSGPLMGPGPTHDRATAEKRYDEQVSRYDARVGAILEALDQGGLARRTVVVLTSNHGLDFMEHGPTVSHGTLHDSTLHVPLVVVDPASPRHGVRQDALVQHIDLAPTVLERSLVPPDATMDGHSLAPLLGLSPAPWQPADIFSMSSLNVISLRTSTAKLMECPSDCCGAVGGPSSATPCRGPQVTRYYDLQTDPGETQDTSAAHPQEVALLQARLAAWRRSLAADSTGARRWEVEEDARKVLQERGYWELAVPQPAPRPEGPSKSR